MAASRHALHYSPTHTIGEKAYDFDVMFSEWTSTGRYDVDGVVETFPSGEEFSKTEFSFLSKYGVSERFDLGVGGRWRQNTSISNTVDLSSSGLESLVGEFKYKLRPMSKRWLLSISGSYRQTLYTNSSFDSTTGAPDDDLVLGDAGSSYEMGAHLTYENTSNHYLYFFGAYHQPANNLSAEMKYSLETAYPYERWLVSLGVEGVYSLGFDEFESSPEDKDVQDTGVTGLFNSINRSYMAPFLRISRGFKGWRLNTFAKQITDGFSTDEGLEFGIGIQMRMAGKSKQQAKIDKFKEYLVEASIVKTSPRGKFYKIDKGIAQDVEKSMSFDIFKADYFGGNILVASGRVIELGADWAIIRVSKMYRKMDVRPGFVARGY